MREIVTKNYCPPSKSEAAACVLDQEKKGIAGKFPELLLTDISEPFRHFLVHLIFHCV